MNREFVIECLVRRWEDEQKRSRLLYWRCWHYLYRLSRPAACSHHDATPEVNASSCHSHTAEHTDLSDSENSLDSNDQCVCIRAESKALVKFENSSPRDLVLLTVIEIGSVDIHNTFVASDRPMLVVPSEKLYGHRNFRPSRTPRACKS